MNVKKLRGEYVLIEPDMTEEVTASGIKIAKKYEQGDLITGVIKVIGTGKIVVSESIPVFVDYAKLDLEVGDKVLFRYGMKLKVNDLFLVLVHESDVVLVIE